MKLTKEMAQKATIVSQQLSYLSGQTIKWHYNHQSNWVNFTIKKETFACIMPHGLFAAKIESGSFIFNMYESFLEKDYPICLEKR